MAPPTLIAERYPVADPTGRFPGDHPSDERLELGRSNLIEVFWRARTRRGREQDAHRTGPALRPRERERTICPRSGRWRSSTGSARAASAFTTSGREGQPGRRTWKMRSSLTLTLW